MNAKTVTVALIAGMGAYLLVRRDALAAADAIADTAKALPEKLADTVFDILNPGARAKMNNPSNGTQIIGPPGTVQDALKQAGYVGLPDWMIPVKPGAKKRTDAGGVYIPKDWDGGSSDVFSTAEYPPSAPGGITRDNWSMVPPGS